LGQTSREDFHTVFSDHAQIKWIDFTRGAKEVRTESASHITLTKSYQVN